MRYADSRRGGDRRGGRPELARHPAHRIAFAACLAGAIVGDSFMYAIGYRWGHGIFTSHPRFAKLLAAENEQQFQQAIKYHALKVMLLARFLVGIRARCT